MKKLCIIIILFSFFGCASSTIIKTLPEGAKVKAMSGELLGITPYDYWDRNESDFTLSLMLEKDGYKPKQITIKKDCLYVHRFFTPPILALPWLFGYQPEYMYELTIFEEASE